MTKQARPQTCSVGQLSLRRETVCGMRATLAKASIRSEGKKQNVMTRGGSRDARMLALKMVEGDKPRNVGGPLKLEKARK